MAFRSRYAASMFFEEGLFYDFFREVCRFGLFFCVIVLVELMCCLFFWLKKSFTEVFLSLCYLYFAG
jgi:hypothetical protein